MNRIGLILSSLMLTFSTATAFAQQETTPGPGYGHMMWGWGGGGGWGWHSGMILGPIIMLLAFIGIIAFIVLLVRIFSHGGYHHHHGICPRCGHGRGRGALEILEERFARGEIGKDEFEEKRKLLGR